ncbi:MAG: transcription-repair coupling factor, partial [Oscillospiraceae bacterium]|nr:transcription-repair coupling factor [Oscillospiraceae bacterium]
MKNICTAIAALAEVRELSDGLCKAGASIAVSGLAPVHRAMLAAALLEREERPLAVICADDAEAARFAADLTALTGKETTLLLGRQWQLRDKIAASHEFEQLRIAALARMARGEAPFVVATVDALLARTISPAALADALTEVELGATLDPQILAARLVHAGYVRCEQVEGAGQFALRGGIVDVYSPLGAPVRIEFFGDEVDAMGEFDAATQRRTKNIDRFTILPAAEVLPFSAVGGAEAMRARMEHAAKKLAGKEAFAAAEKTLLADIERLKNGLSLGGIDRYLAAAYPDAVTAADYLAPDALVLSCEGVRLLERGRLYAQEEAEDTRVLLEEGALCGAFAERSVSMEQLCAKLASHPMAHLDALPTSRYLAPPKALMNMNVRSLPSYGGSLETAAADIEHFLATGSAVAVLCSSETRGRNLLRLLEERGIAARPDFKGEALPESGEVTVSLGALSAGSEWPQCHLAVLTEGQFTTTSAGKERRAKLKADSSRQKLRSYTDLNPGDLVVHIHHGIGRFVGMERMKVDGVVKDYIKIAYAGADSLYVPATQLDMVAKYIGSGGMDENGERVARLSKLGGTDWTKAKSRAKAAAKDLAKGLIALYAERQRRPGFAFSPDSPWQREFEDAFDYVET